MPYVEFAFVEAVFCSVAHLVRSLIVELEFGELTFCLIWVGKFYTVETSVGDRSWNRLTAQNNECTQLTVIVNGPLSLRAFQKSFQAATGHTRESTAGS